MEDELEQPGQTTRVEKTSSESPLSEQSESQDPQTVPQEQEVTSEKANLQPSDPKGISTDDTEDKPTDARVHVGDSNSSGSTAESELSTEAQELSSSSVSSTQPIRGGQQQYKLAFDVDDTGSEASLTSSPRSVDMSNPVTSYLSQHHYLPSPMASQSHDLESLSHDMLSESCDHKEETVESTGDGDDTKPKASTTTIEDDVSSVYSSSTLRPGSVSEPDVASKPPPPSDTSEKEREESVKTPDSVVKMEDITLTTVSSDGSQRETPPPHPKVHALNILTSDSDAGESPPYSPVPYMSGEWTITERVCVILKCACTRTCMQ